MIRASHGPMMPRRRPWRWLIAWCVTLALAGTVATATPDPAVQREIDRVVGQIAASDTDADRSAIVAAADRLQQQFTGERDALLLELLRYLRSASGTERTMGAALLLDYYGFTVDEKLAAVVPHLADDDLELRAVLEDLLGTIDRSQGGEIDFAPYEDWLASGADSDGLVRYMVHAAPEAAIETLARTWPDDVGDPTSLDEARAVLTSAKPGDAGCRDRARAQLDLLSRHGAWWVRLYAAELLSRRPDLGTPEVTLRLQRDAHPLVRGALY